MAVAWVLVADSSRARIFSKNGREAYVEESGFIHPESRLHEQQLTSDLPGSASSHVGGERHGVNAKVPPKQHEAMVFSRQVADHLETARTQGRFNKLAIVAPPAFLGLLREQFSSALSGVVTSEINKNLVQLKPHDLMPHLPARL